MLSRLLLSVAVVSMVCLATAAEPSSVPRAIDPDGEIHGVRFGATDPQLRARLGPPSGSLQINDSKHVLLYGKSHAFVFRKGRFVELHLMRYLLDWELLDQMEDHPLLNSRRWTLDPGIEDGMAFGEIMRLLKKTNVRPDSRYTYETEKAAVELTFSNRVDRKGMPDEFTLWSVRIKSLLVQ